MRLPKNPKDKDFQDRTAHPVYGYREYLHDRDILTEEEEELRKKNNWTKADILVIREMKRANDDVKGFGESRFPENPRGEYHIDPDEKSKGLPPKRRDMRFGDRPRGN